MKLSVDESSPHDPLSRMNRHQRRQGTAGGGQAPVPALTSYWGLDPTDNWTWFIERELQGAGGASGSGPGGAGQARLQVRRHNARNQISNLLSLNSSDRWAQPRYDAAGNTIRIPSPKSPSEAWDCKYDAWNRLRQIKRRGRPLLEFDYDGLGRRIVKRTYDQGRLKETRYYYYDAQWRILEERIVRRGVRPHDTPPERLYVWGLRDLNDLVLRLRDSNGDGAFDEQLYALHDANFNTVALSDPSGKIVESFLYDAYGRPLFFDGQTFQQESPHDWTLLFGGYHYDAETGLYEVRRRIYHPLLGRWLQQDPQGMAEHPNLYQYGLSSPLTYVDPSGEIIFLATAMLIIGLAGVAAAHYGAHEMSEAVNTGDMERFKRGQAWFTGGVAAVGAAAGLGVGSVVFSGTAAAFGSTAAGVQTSLGTAGWTALAASTLSGAAGGATSTALTAGLTTYGLGGSVEESLTAAGRGALKGGFYGGVGGLAGGAVVWRLGASLHGTLLSGFAGGAAAGGLQGGIESGSLRGAFEGMVTGGLTGAAFAGAGWGVGRLSGWIRPLGNYPRQLGRPPRGFMVKTLRPGSPRFRSHARTLFERLLVRTVPGSNRASLRYGGLRTRRNFVRHHVKEITLGGSDVRANVRYVRVERHAVAHPPTHTWNDAPGVIYF
jgi:RHS repeat-associated protein